MKRRKTMSGVTGLLLLAGLGYLAFFLLADPRVVWSGEKNLP
jgi:hypothetical protein